MNCSVRAGMDKSVVVKAANRCVACGLCLPHCPTYRMTGSEADSPRGRVMLVRGVLDGSLPLTADVAVHLDRCLVCRACETACPSGVAYGELIDGAREMASQSGRGVRGLARWLPRLLASQMLLEPAGWLRFRDYYPALGESRGAVSLFVGCVSRLVDAGTLRAAIFVLNRLGYDVHVPRGQGCCGAMHRHGGDPLHAEALARRNLDALAPRAANEPAQERAQERGQEDMPIVFVASACGASLAEYGCYGERGKAFARRATDIVSFLGQAHGWEAEAIAPLPESVAVHEPCSARNVLRNAADSYRLMERIPQARVVSLPGNAQCCGSAGLYFLDQPHMAGTLLADKMQSARGGDTRYLVSTNYGCARWLAKGLRDEGRTVEVMHPVTLLAKQMGFTETC